jgi:hypothetical protein
MSNAEACNKLSNHMLKQAHETWQKRQHHYGNNQF